MGCLAAVFGGLRLNLGKMGRLVSLILGAHVRGKMRGKSRDSLHRSIKEVMSADVRRM